ncbi:MAG: undecaprenyl-diphosphate phosphatase [Chitinophagales bacterium]
MTNLEAVALAIVEGLTEFLPVSSTGHMIVAQGLLHIKESSFVKVYLVNIQFGAIMAVLALYYRRFFQGLDFYKKLFVAFLPAAILGFALNKVIDQLLESVTTVAISLIVGGIVLVLTDKIFHAQIVETPDPEIEVEPDSDNIDATSKIVVTPLPLTFLQSLIIGFCQTIAMIPGVSRSAATIIGGLTQKLTMRQAAEFSFFLAVPTITAAAMYKTYKDFDHIKGTDLGQLALGNIVAFLVALIAIRYFVNFISQHGMKLFGYYRILVGVLILVALYVFHLPLEIIK